MTAGIMASIATALGLGSLALTRPTHVAAVVTPITIAAVDHRLVPAPVLEVRDRFGRPVRSFAGSAFAALTGTSERLSGDVAVPFVRGRAVFDRVYLPTSYDTLFRLAFDVPSLPRLTIPPLEFTDRANALFLVDGSVNGIPVSPERRTVLVEPGAPVRVTVTLRYSSTYAAASLMLGATVTWGEHETAWATISPLVTPTRNQPTQARVYFTAPVEPGIYYLIFAWGAEDGVANVLSATNWTVGTPIWNDGNDIAD